MELIIHRDEHLLVVNKPPTIPVQADLTADEDLLTMISKRVRKQMLLVHRLDRPASGLVIIARNKEIAALLSQQFQKRQIEKKYLVAISGELPEQEGSLTHYLKRDGRTKKSLARATPEKDFLEARLNYKFIMAGSRYNIYELELETGRFHQIRAQLGLNKTPIKGDVKYGARRRNRDRAIHLHAHYLSFKHPITGEVLSVNSSPPEDSIWNLIL